MTWTRPSAIRRSEARREATLRSIENAIAGTVARIDAERRQLDAFERRLIPTATDLQALAEESYRAGRTSVLCLIESQRALRELRRDALQAALDLQLSIADLAETIGPALRSTPRNVRRVRLSADLRTG